MLRNRSISQHCAGDAFSGLVAVISPLTVEGFEDMLTVKEQRWELL
jgi:hypothetical protein